MSDTHETAGDAPTEQKAVTRPADPALIRGLRAAMSAQRPAVIAHTTKGTSTMRATVTVLGIFRRPVSCTVRT